MEWYVYLAHFFAGAFLANGVPHFVNGISGRKFQTPFASPPGVGESSPVVNVLWGFANFVIGYLLLTGIGHFTYGPSIDSLVAGLGIVAISFVLSRHFSRFHGH
jgi:hypothetical protein